MADGSARAEREKLVRELRALLAAQPPKTGAKTSELWVVAAVGLIAVVNNRLGLGLTETEILALAGAAISYLAARTWTKAR